MITIHIHIHIHITIINIVTITLPRIADGLAKELVDAYNLVGRAMAKKHEHHRQCEQNRAYAHYRRTK